MARFAVAILVAVVAAAPPAARAGADDGRCEFSRAYFVLSKTREAVIIARRTGDQPVYGCLYRRDRFYYLSDHSPVYRTAGRYVAYQSVEPDPVTGTTYFLFVTDLRRGSTRRAEPLYAYDDIDDGTVNSRIADVTLKRNGSVAWIACRSSDPNAERCDGGSSAHQVWRSDLRGTRLLDDSARVRRRSLRRKRSTIRWRHGGETRRARLK